MLKLVVTFHTTTDAMAMEALCKKRSISGRMIPVPRSISAGCGLAWCTEVEAKEEIQHLLREESLEAEGIHECLV